MAIIKVSSSFARVLTACVLAVIGFFIIVFATSVPRLFTSIFGADTVYADHTTSCDPYFCEENCGGGGCCSDGSTGADACTW